MNKQNVTNSIHELLCPLAKRQDEVDQRQLLKTAQLLDEKVDYILKSNMLLKALLQDIPEGVEVADANGNILYLNEKFDEITHLREERLHENIFDVNPNGFLAQTLIKQKSFFDIVTVAPETGGKAIARTSLILNEDKNIVGAVITIRDINTTIKLVNELTQIDKEQLKVNNNNQSEYTFDDIIGNSTPIKQSIHLARKIAPTDSTVLLQGESGTGKELFAQSIHAESHRSKNPLHAINCSTIPEYLFESELFGHEKGAFTGANNRKVGIFELANGGTLLLDEIGELPLSLQPKLLRVLQEGKIRRVGGGKELTVNVRIVANTNQDLKELIEKGEFRKDLYYRLNIISLRIPPLRERVDDISKLSNFFIRKYNAILNKHVKSINNEAVRALHSYDWPGNIRELENVIEFAVLVTETDIISLKDIEVKIAPSDNHNLESDSFSLKEIEQRTIRKALDTYGKTLDGKEQAAKSLGISIATLYNKMKKYQI